MGAEPTLPLMSVNEFLDWAETQPGRYELEGGRIVAMSPERIRHVVVKGAAYAALRAACRQFAGGCHALTDGMTVRIDANTAYEPDALVYCGAELPGDATEVRQPVIVVEVLSPSTAYRDVGAKLAGYFGLESVAHYLIVDPERSTIVHHARAEGDLIATRIVSHGALKLEPPGLILDAADLLGSS